MLPRLSINSSRRSENLDLRTQSRTKAPLSHIEKDRVRLQPPRTTPWSPKPGIMGRRRKTLTSGVSSIKAPLTTQVNVRPSSHLWPSWGIWIRRMLRLWVITRQGKWKREADHLRRTQCHYGHHQDLEYWAWISKRGGAPIPLTDVGEGFSVVVHCRQREPKETHFSRGHGELGRSTTTHSQLYTIGWLHQGWDLCLIQ